MPIVTGIIRDIPNADPVVGATVTLHLESDDSQIDSTTTDSSGRFSFTVEPWPGDCYAEWDAGTVVKRFTTGSIMPVGTLDLSALESFLTIWSDGVNPNYGDAFAVSTSTLMNVAIGSGVAVIDGRLVWMSTGTTQAIAAAHSTLNRKDVIYLASYDEDATAPGKWEIGYLAGTPASSPTRPTPSVTNGDYLLLAEVTVDAGVTSIASGKITDLRANASPSGAGITLEDDNVVKGVVSGLDIKHPLTSTYNGADTPADIGIYRSAMTPLTDTGYGTSAANVTSGTSDTALTMDSTCVIPYLLNIQTYRVQVEVSIDAEGVGGALADGYIGVKIGSAAIAYSPIAFRWEQGVDTSHQWTHQADVAGANAPVTVAIYYKRSSGSIDFKYYEAKATATPVFFDGA